MKKRTIRVGCNAAAMALGMMLALPAAANNDAMLELLTVLRDNGTINQEAYELLRNSALADEDKRVAGQTQRTAPAADTTKVEEQVAAIEKTVDEVSWAGKIKLKGDLRTRYQYQDEDRANDRSRGRLRYRLGVTAQPAHGWEVGAGLASGGDDPRSTNQSFDDSFSTKGINLDYAYMQYAFDYGLTAIAGKFLRKAYLWAPTDVMWDGDINPEGVSLNYTATNAWGGFFANTGVWVLEENAGTDDDPYMGYVQLGQQWHHDRWSGTLAATGYVFADIDVLADLGRAEGTNTDAKFSAFNLAGDVGTKLAAGDARLLGEYINNPETDTTQDTAWAVGVKYTWQKWAFKYLYADVEANSVPDFLPDSDRFDGLTGIRGHEFEVNYDIMKNVTAAVDYYNVEDIATDVDQHVLQLDLNVKF